MKVKYKRREQKDDAYPTISRHNEVAMEYKDYIAVRDAKYNDLVTLSDGVTYRVVRPKTPDWTTSGPTGGLDAIDGVREAHNR